MRERNEWDRRDHRRSMAAAIAVGVFVVSGPSLYLAYDVHEHGSLSERLGEDVTGIGNNLKSGIHNLAVEIANATD